MRRSEISFEKIRELAEEAGREHWRAFLATGEAPLLNGCLNIRRAWMFFRNPEIQIPPEASLRKCAIVVSDRGEVRFTADYYPDLTKCGEYLQEMSDYFERKNI